MIARLVACAAVNWFCAGVALANAFGDAEEQLRLATTKLTSAQSAAGDTVALARIQQEALDHFREARRLFEDGGIDNTDDAKAAYTYGDLLIRMGDTDLAVDSLRRAHELDPDNAAFGVGYGSVLVQLGDGYEADASAALTSVVERQPDSPAAGEAYAQLAELYRRSGLYDMVLESCDSALTIDEKHAGALFLKAVCLAREGRFEEANTIMDDIAVRAPALAADERGKLYDAVRDFERRNRWVANTADEHAAYGKMLIRVNRLPDSMDPLRQAVRLNPNDAVVWNLLGSVYRQRNRIDDARHAFEQSLKLNPNQERTRQVLDEMSAAVPATP